jgi:hypothetical protein
MGAMVKAVQTEFETTNKRVEGVLASDDQRTQRLYENSTLRFKRHDQKYKR